MPVKKKKIQWDSRKSLPISMRANTASDGITLVLPANSAKAFELLPASFMTEIIH